MTADTLSPLLRDLCAKVAPIEARLAVLDGEIATLTAERDGLRATLDGIQRALDPRQEALPLAGLGSPVPLREPTRAGAALLARAEDGQIVIARDKAGRGELKAAASMAAGERPLLRLVGKTAAYVIYGVTEDGEIRRRELAGPGAIATAGEAEKGGSDGSE